MNGTQVLVTPRSGRRRNVPAKKVIHPWPLRVRAALHFRPPYEVGVYNAVRRLLYLGVIAPGTLAVFSGLSVWKPFQLWPL